MYVALGRVANDSFVVFAGCWVGFDIYSKGAVELELQSGI